MKKKYIESINSKELFENSFKSLIPQTAAHDVILKHFSKKSDKKQKCIFIGWDGCRADAMRYIIKTENKNISGENGRNVFSAVTALKDVGGLYLTYVGGDEPNTQETSTAQGWASALCGKWMKREWKDGVAWSVDDDYPTVLRELAEKGFKTSFNAIWPIHFDMTYADEAENAAKNNLPESFFRYDTDEQLHEALIEKIKGEDDFIFGIYENPDMNGHGTGFGDENYRYVAGICNLDRLSYVLLQEIKKRPAFKEEDWLVVIGSDYGGHGTGHGTQKIEDRITFLALSTPLAD